MFNMSRAARRLASVLADGRHFRRFVVVPIGLVLTFAVVPAAVAGQPVSQALNPEPADFYACIAIGDGTICRAHTVEPYEGELTGIVCGVGVGTVEILDNGVRDVRATRWYDRDGNLTRRLRTFLFRDAHLSNPATGRVLAYTQHNTDDEILGVPGDLNSVTWTGHGHLSVTAPGFGPVLIGAGRTVVGPEGDILAESGVSRLDVDGLCEALGTPNG